MKRLVLGIALLAIVGGIAYWHSHRNRPPLEEVFAGSRKVTVWSSNAQVREPLVYASFGDRFEVLDHSGNSLQIRTAKGVEGWVALSDVLPADLWQKAQALTTEARKMPVQAAAHTKVLTNLRLDPGRDGARIFQLGRDTPVSLLERRVVDIQATPTANQADDDASAGEPATTKKEDWLLVLAHTKEQGDFAGWVVGRFVAMDLPQPLPDYTSSAGMRVTGWMELNRVTAQGQPRPQYLVFGTRGPEGDICDFSTLRVYTWGAKRERYETAFVDSGFCAQMPVEVTPAAQLGGDATFHFMTVGESGKQERAYRMHQTIVRRTDENRGKRRATVKPKVKPAAKSH
ncbi:MAG: SH3 domain-containing protein [Candidatus Acidiferrales bacterium]